jgi:hypothetical protein
MHRGAIRRAAGAIGICGLLCVSVVPVSAQTFTQRGFADISGAFFPQSAGNDSTQLAGDALFREEVFVTPAAWLQLAAGIDARANTHDQVEQSWRVDIRDRGVLRPALSIRRLSATLSRRAVTVDIGKQFIRWGKADIVTPTDRFAPRDFLNVVDSEFLPVTGLRFVGQWGANTIDTAWVPFLTPSRMPLLDQRWTVVPAAARSLTLVDVSPEPPKGSQAGIRWSRTGAGYEYSLSYFDGFNTLPDIAIRPGTTPTEIGIARVYPAIRSYGADAAVPLRWFTVKGEAAYVTSSSPASDEYVLYVVQLERQSGEWLLLGGYAGEATTARHAVLSFAPDRGLTRAFMARASYTIDTNRSLTLETAVRQTGRGVYAKGEYSQARGPHWRATMSGAIIRGDDDDFLGQYRRNSHVTLSLRYSF